MGVRVELHIGYQSDAGPARKLNEDYIGCVVPKDEAQRRTKGALFLVADGMGGHNAGAVASRKAVEQVAREYYADTVGDNGDCLVQAVEAANQMLYDLAQGDPSQAGMGTTLVAAVVHGTPPHATIANVGDSRAYLLRRRRLAQITRDHSWVEEQLRAGLLTPAQAARHPQRNVITRALGSRPTVEVDLFEADLGEGDVLLLCSDGLSGELSARQMARILRSQPPARAAAQLVTGANARGGNDNASAVVVQAGARETMRSRWLPGPIAGTWGQNIDRLWARGRRVPLVAALAVLCLVCLASGVALTASLVGREFVAGPAAAPQLAPIVANDAQGAESESRLLSGSLPEQRGVFLVGPVRDWHCQKAVCSFALAMAGKEYEVRCDRQNAVDKGLVLRGRRVRVFGYQDAEGSVVDARLIDVGAAWWALWREPWVTVYQAQNWDETVWVYTIVDENPYSPVTQDFLGLKRGDRIVARGRWLEAKAGQNMAFVTEAVYWLQGEGYVPLPGEGE
jgi:serine/threonine protein phosphatase PrpC